MCVVYFCFFKHKTAYDMRFSDWSSDVCSSDLSIGVAPLITGLDFDALIADKAFDSNALRATLNERGALALIPSNASRAGAIPYDEEMYKWRHLVENFVQKIKEFRRIATRYDKTDTSYAAALHLVGAYRSEEHTSELQSLMRISYAVYF